MIYRYDHFERQIVLDELRFRGGPQLGEPMPPMNLVTTDGGCLRSADFYGWQPIFLTLGSITCPMTRAAHDGLFRLYREFGDRVAFVSLYVREAFPGDRWRQPQNFDVKMAHARAYKENHGIPWTVAVDDIDGTYHRKLDCKPNSAYLINRSGNVVFRSLWSDDERALRAGFEALLSGRLMEKQTLFVPMLHGLGVMAETLASAGRSAERDLWLGAPPIALLSRVASWFRPLSPAARTIAGAVTIGAAIAGFALLARKIANNA